MTDACNHMKWDNPDDPMPMICTRKALHEGDHMPTSNGGVWATWPNDEEVA